MSIFTLIEKQKEQIQIALPSHMDAGRIIRVAATALRNKPQLADCDPHSVLGSLMLASQLGLEINSPLGQAYLIPFKKKATFVLGYQGLIDLCYRSGIYRSIYAREVYPEDLFHYEYGLKPKLKHEPMKKHTKDKPAFYYAVYKTSEGKDFVVMPYESVVEYGRKNSRSFNEGPWQTHFDEMAKKTCLKKVLKYAPKSIELVTQVSKDGNTVFLNDSGEIVGEYDEVIDVPGKPLAVLDSILTPDENVMTSIVN